METEKKPLLKYEMNQPILNTLISLYNDNRWDLVEHGVWRNMKRNLSNSEIDDIVFMMEDFIKNSK